MCIKNMKKRHFNGLCRASGLCRVVLAAAGFADVVRCGVLVCGIVSGRCLSCVRNVLTARGLLAGDFGCAKRPRIGL